MFAFDFKAEKPKPKAPFVKQNDWAMQNFLRQGSVKILPVAKDIIVLRLENLADMFDGPRSGQPHYLNLQKLGRDIYQGVNGKMP